MIRSNFHTHTAFCDGKDSPEELVQAALALGFTHLGFSGHAPGPSESYAMSPEGLHKYCREIARLKAEYKGRLNILCGIELDLFSDARGRDFDFCIASAHSLENEGGYLYIDESPEAESANLLHFGGSFESYAAAYYAAVKASVERHRPDIIGHIDLVTKFCEVTGRSLSPEYWDIAEDAVRALAAWDIPFEINTGAMARGYRSSPYPAERLLRCVRKCGGSIIISSDCHDRGMLAHGFAAAARLAVESGFEHHVIITGHGREYLPL